MIIVIILHMYELQYDISNVYMRVLIRSEKLTFLYDFIFGAFENSLILAIHNIKQVIRKYAHLMLL